jgi:hypothetical protein
MTTGVTKLLKGDIITVVSEQKQTLQVAGSIG